MAIEAVLAGSSRVPVGAGGRRWSLLVFGAFLVIDLTFLSANALKLSRAAGFRSSWLQGVRDHVDLAPRPPVWSRACTAGRPRCALYHEPVAAAAHRACPARRSSSLPVRHVPRALLQNLEHNHVVHEKVVFLKVETEDVPRVAYLGAPCGRAPRRRHPALRGSLRLHGAAGRTAVLTSCQLGPPEPTLMDTSFFLSRETFLPSARPDLPRWRERIFIHMANAALDATRYFRLPPGPGGRGGRPGRDLVLGIISQ